jgi:hypothetical protein
LIGAGFPLALMAARRLNMRSSHGPI